MDNLKPCPFCGTDPVMETFTTAREKVPRYRIRCPGCRIESDWDWFDPDELAALWNKPERNSDAEASSAIRRLRRDLKDCRNELCSRCGNYKESHMGACDGCRWKDVGD